MILSKNFTLQELIKSPVADRLCIDNTPTDEAKLNLYALATKILQPVRDYFELPVTITSGYRCPKLNKKIGSSPESQHTKGQAADFEINTISNVFLAKWIEKNLEFDQLILEFYNKGEPHSGWVHCSYSADTPNRRSILTITKTGTYKGIVIW
jgi:hypothetical protein